jgi:hypothetical protein
MNKKRIFLEAAVFFCIMTLKGQNGGFADSALVSRKIDRITGIWHYTNTQKDTLIIEMKRVPMKYINPVIDLNVHTTIARVYYKKGDSLIQQDFLPYSINKPLDSSNYTLIGTYLKYLDAVALLYTDKKLKHVCEIHLFKKKSRKLYWDVQFHPPDNTQQKDRFFYPEKLVLRKMKKNLL